MTHYKKISEKYPVLRTERHTMYIITKAAIVRPLNAERYMVNMSKEF